MFGGDDEGRGDGGRGGEAGEISRPVHLCRGE